MKKTIITMLIALVAICASAETYSYLKFTKTNGSTVTCSVEGLKITYDNTNVTVTNAEGTTTIAETFVMPVEQAKVAEKVKSAAAAAKDKAEQAMARSKAKNATHGK
jgi:hypothetical protein